MTRHNLRRPATIAIFAMCVTVSLLFSGCRSPLPTTVAPEVGSLAPDFEVTLLDGGTVSLEGLKGKPIMLLFWRTTCGACNANMPHVQAAFEEKGEEVQIIAVGLDASSDAIQQYVESRGLGFTIALGADGVAANSYQIMYIPTTFFIDSRGVITGKQVGAYGSADDLLTAIEDNLL
jgi:peroxiredoxin